MSVRFQGKPFNITVIMTIKTNKCWKRGVLMPLLETNKKLTNISGPSILCVWGGGRGVKLKQCDTDLCTYEESSEFLNNQIKFRSFWHTEAKTVSKEFPGDPVIRTQGFHLGAWLLSPVGELRSCKLSNTAKKSPVPITGTPTMEKSMEIP